MLSTLANYVFVIRHSVSYQLSEWLNYWLNYWTIKTHGSESRGQEEAGLRDEPVSYLQVAPL